MAMNSFYSTLVIKTKPQLKEAKQLFRNLNNASGWRGTGIFLDFFESI
jgi:hypothetical protein